MSPRVPRSLPSRERLWELVRYYQAGVVNTAFGYGGYALLLWLGLGRYQAQLVSHVAGTAFNYLTYSRHVFRDAAPAKGRFALSYLGNYLMGLAGLWLVSRLIANPYAAGLVAVVAVSVVNYFVLRHFVFGKREA